VVWDVGHQSYAWKILTGRNARFDTLRTLNGLSGFTNRSESEYDSFGTGHSSTSVSAALGMAAGRDILAETGHSIAIIGDGALTGGMSFEALNHAGHLQKDKLIVILNDNAMSISKNVGGLQKYMARMLASKSYNSLKKQVWEMSNSLPSSVRRRFIYGAQKLEESMMNILVPNIIFEDLGFKYVGPIDGHDIEQVTAMLTRVRDNMIGPILVHVVTKKGKGYSPAEKDSSLFHGIGPFEEKSGKPVCSGSESWSEIMGNSLIRLADKNDKVVAITAAMASGTGLSGFESLYPERFFDVGIAEQHAVTFAAGLATKGLKPFIAIYSTFYQRALDQIIHDVALQKLPVVFCIDRAGLVGEDGATHHGAFDISFLNYIPNLVILAPSSAEDLDNMMHWAATYQDGPVAIRYPRGTAFCSGKKHASFSPGKAAVLHKGEKLALVSCGDTRSMVEEIHQELKKAGHNPMMIDLCSVKPLDLKLFDKLGQELSHIFTFETNSRIGGFGAHLAQELALHPARVYNFGYPDRFIPHGSKIELNSMIDFHSEAIVDRIKTIIGENA
jgi:1-deoxy-D-xylulose-5-phosphate synthase